MDIHTYVGDKKITALLKKHYPNTSFADLRAALVGAIFAVDHIPPSAILDHVFAEEDDVEFENEKDAKDFFVCMMSFWNELTKYQDEKTPFTFTPWPASLSYEDHELLLLHANQLSREIQYFCDSLAEGGVPFADNFESPSSDAIQAWTPSLLEVSQNLLRKQINALSSDPTAGIILCSLPIMIKERMQENHADFVTNIKAWRMEALEDIGPSTVMQENTKIGRNEPCPCGSGKKYKKCCA